MKRIFLLLSAMLLCSGQSFAGDLKVMVPVDELKQLKSRLEALERENGQLRQQSAVVQAAPVATPPAPVNGELQSRLLAVESENNRLRQELAAARDRAPQAAGNGEMQARLDAVERENRQLKETQARQAAAGTSGDAGLAARMQTAENENIKLQQEIKSLKEGGLAAVFAENKMSAREQYYLKRKKSISHAYKF